MANWMRWKHRWRTADGEVIRIVDMDDRHLCNTIRMLVRWADRAINYELEAAFSCEMMLSGDEALAQVDSAIDDLMRACPTDYAYNHYRPFPKMLEEAAKREMTV